MARAEEARKKAVEVEEVRKKAKEAEEAKKKAEERARRAQEREAEEAAKSRVSATFLLGENEANSGRPSASTQSRALSRGH